MVRATKNPPRLRNKLTYAPDAVSREYRGKMIACKSFFACVFTSEQKESLTLISCHTPGKGAGGFARNDK